MEAKQVAQDSLPLITVVIPTYNDWEDLLRCITALQEQTYPSEKYEVIVANNNPNNTKPSWLDNFLTIKVIDVEIPGSYAARNAALKIAMGDVIAFTDSDCTPEKDWLMQGISHLLLGHDRVAGHVSLYFENERRSVAELYEKIFAFQQKRNAQNGESVTANLFTWKSLFTDVGFFDDSLMSGGDLQWNRRASKLGKTIAYAEDCVVYHPTRATLKELLRKKKRISRGAVAAGLIKKSDYFIRGLVPPVFVIPRIFKTHGLTFIQKLSVFGICYLLKVYSVFQVYGYIMGLGKQTRR